jgi:hypothetical protein
VFLGIVAEVVAAHFGAVAAADQEEVADLAGLDRLDDRVRQYSPGSPVMEADGRFPVEVPRHGAFLALAMTGEKSSLVIRTFRRAQRWRGW